MNTKKFWEIKKAYDHFYKSLLKKGQLPFRTTHGGFWGNAVAEEIYGAFKQTSLYNHTTFVDLGSGDGKVALIASLFCKNVVGVEMDPELVKTAQWMQKQLLIPNVLFHQDNFHNHAVSGYDVVFVYPDVPMHRGLEKKLQNELKGKLIHYGHQFQPQSFKIIQSFKVNGTPVHVYSK